jgi:hypothetical protein
MRKNPLTMKVFIDLPEPKAMRDIDKFIDRLVAKMEGRLKSKEDVFTLAYVVIRRVKGLLPSCIEEEECICHDALPLEVEITYEGASALAYELKTYPARPEGGVLVQLLNQLDQGLREKKQHDRDRKRGAKQRNRPTVRESRGL